MSELVSLRRDGNVGVVTVDNPPVNAISNAVRIGLIARLAEAKADPGIAAVVLACAGRTFMAGADITEFGKFKSPGTSDVIAAVETLGKPVVAALHGTPLGGGLEIALGCHFRVAAPGTRARPARDQARHHSGRRRHPAPAAPRRPGKGPRHDPHRRPDLGAGRARQRAGRRDRRGRRDGGGGRVREEGRGREAAAGARARPQREARQCRSRKIRRARRRLRQARQGAAGADGGGRDAPQRARPADRRRPAARVGRVSRAHRQRAGEIAAPRLLRRARGGEDRRHPGRHQAARDQARRHHRRRHHGRRHRDVLRQCGHPGDGGRDVGRRARRAGSTPSRRTTRARPRAAASSRRRRSGASA